MACFEALDATAAFMQSVEDVDADQRSDATLLLEEDELDLQGQGVEVVDALPPTLQGFDPGFDVQDQGIEVVDAQPAAPQGCNLEGPGARPTCEEMVALIGPDGMCCPGFPQRVGSQCENCGAEVPAIP